MNIKAENLIKKCTTIIRIISNSWERRWNAYVVNPAEYKYIVIGEENISVL